MPLHILTFTGRRRKRELIKHTTESRKTFQTLRASPGTYKLTVMSLNTDSRVKFFVSTNALCQPGYPNLPTNTAITTRLKKRNVFVSWSSALSANNGNNNIKYCVGIGLIKNFKTHCALLAHLKGDKPPTFTRWDWPGQKKIINQNKARANPLRRVKRRLLFYKCTDDKTSFSYNKIKRGKKYFIDVFVVDKKTNKASAYNGTIIERKKKGKKKKKPYSLLSIGETKTISLAKNKGFEINISQNVAKLQFEMLPCAGQKVNFVLTDSRKKRRKHGKLRHWKRIVFKNAKPGVYHMTFPGKRRKSSFVTVSLVSKINKSNIKLPMVRSLKVQDKTCNNVTLKWMAPTTSHEYCVYRHILDKDMKNYRHHACLSPSERPLSERVLCTTYEPQSLMSSEYIRQTSTIRGLKASTWYRFDVFLRTGQSIMIPFRGIKEKTC